MQETADMELLRQYAHRNSEEAFAALVTRHVNMVYSAALRKTGNAHAAEEITQVVFIILAKKADRLRDGTILSGLLYQTARLTSASFLRTEIRRARREQEAYMQSLSNEPEVTVWPEIEPLLEDAMGKLGEKERNALALRFFEGKSFQEIGTAVGASENAAKKRVHHGLEKLRKFFSKRGVVSTTTIIAGAISANSVQAAPALLAKSVTAVAIAKGAAASGSTLILIKGALKIMAWTKAKTITVVALAAIIGASVTTVAVKKLVQPKTTVAATYPGDWIWTPYSQSFNRVPPIFLLQPYTLPVKTAPYDYMGKDGYMARGKTLRELITTIWSQKNSAIKLIFTADLPENKFDFIVTSQPHWWDKLESEINKRFNLVEQIETRETGVVVVVEKVR